MKKKSDIEKELRNYYRMEAENYIMPDETDITAIRNAKAKSGSASADRTKKASERKKIYRRIAVITVCVIAILSLSAVTIFAVSEPLRESVYEILEYWHNHPEEKVKNTDPGYKAELKKKVREEMGVTERTEAKITEYPVEETVDLNDFDYTSIDLVTITNGMTGKKVDITDAEAIGRITAFLKKISGSSPVSSRGYSGFYYDISLFKGNSEFLNIGFMQKLSFSYGVYEEVNGHKYACLYKTTDVDAEEILDFFSDFCK